MTEYPVPRPSQQFCQFAVSQTAESTRISRSETFKLAWGSSDSRADPPYPFQLSDDPATSYEQLREFHARDGMDKIVDDMYYSGVPGQKGRIVDVLSTFLHPSRGERSRGFRQARGLLQQLGAKSAPAAIVGLTVAERLSRAEGLQAVGEHSAALSLLNRLLMEEPGNGALYLAAAKSLDATGEAAAAKNFRERARSVLRSGA